MFSPSVENLVAQLTRLPSVGQRTAQRLAFHLLSVPKEEALALARALVGEHPEVAATLLEVALGRLAENASAGNS